jgi:hypothetical protein
MLGGGSVVLVTEPEGMDELRERLRRAEDDARAARYLAGGADRDTAELRAEVREFRAETRAEFSDVRGEMRTFRDQNNRVLSALREDLTDLREQMNQGFARVDEQFALVAQEFAQVDRNFLAVRGVLDATAAGQQQIVARIDAVLRRQDDDRPIPS